MKNDDPAGRGRARGLHFLLITAIGWGLNWPAIKFLLQEWPPLFSRGLAGVMAAALLAAVALARGERLALPPRDLPRMAVASFTNVFAWMGFTTIAMQWLTVGEGAMLVYTMPIWATLFAWPLRGARPGPLGIAALCLDHGVREGVFRRGVDPNQLYISIAALGYYYLTNRFTGAIVYERDLMTSEALDARLAFNFETILRLLRA